MGFAALSPSVAVPAVPQVAATGLTVHVLDESDKPVWLAQVAVSGPKNRAAETTRNGDAVFPSVPPGKYRVRVAKYGYVGAYTAIVVNIVNAEATVHLTRVHFKQIAAVAAKTSPEAAASRVAEDSTSAQLNDSLITGIESLPGISIGANGQASIDGYSPNQTSLAINGVPISLPGTAQNLNVFNASVFSSASVAPGAGGGGTIGFETRSPTLAWQGVARAVLASNSGEDLALQEEGTAGDVGISYSHAHNVLSDALDGKSYLDTSGLFYAHDAAAAVNADALQLRYEFSPQNTLLATGVSLDSFIPSVCRTWTGTLPCGYGPTNVQRESVQTVQLKDIATFVESSVALTVYANRIRNDFDQSGYYVNGINEPSSSLSDSRQSGAIANMEFQIGTFQLPLQVSTSSVRTSSSGNAFGPLLPSVLSAYSSLNASSTLPIVKRPRARAGLSLGFQSFSSDGAAQSATATSLFASYSLGAHDGLSFEYGPGNLSGPVAGYNGVSSPAQLQFICASHTAIGVGPTNATQQKATQTSTNVGWSHQGVRWNIQVSLHRNVQYNGPISATVGALALDPALFSPDYLAQVQQSESAACGNSPPARLGNMFFAVSGPGNRAVYSGAQVTGSVDVGSRSHVRFSYGTNLARAYGVDSLVFGPLSTVIAGEQLPNVPMHNASASINTSIGNSTSALFQATYQSGNNPSNVPAYTTFDAGVLVRAPRGLLSVTMTNIGDVYPGPFATAANAVPLPIDGGQLPTIASPLAPRTLRVGYRFAVGLPERQATFDIPSEQFQELGSGFVTHWGGTPFESGPPRDAFAVNRQDVYCGPKDVALAEATLKIWHAYAEAIEKAKVNGAYPESFPPLVDDALSLYYRRNGASYTILMAISGAPPTSAGEQHLARADFRRFAREAQPFMNCVVLHSGSELEYKERNLYVAPSRPFNFWTTLPKYAPEVGFYSQPLLSLSVSARAPSQPTANNPYPAVREPQALPGKPFALKDWPACSPEMRPASMELLEALEQYAHAFFGLHQRPTNPQGLLIVPHTEQSGKTWLEIRTEDLTALQALQQCMFMTSRIRATLEREGLDGAESGEINYAPGVGLYIVNG